MPTRARYVGQCNTVRGRSATDEDRWLCMMANAEPIAESTFLRYVDLSPLLDEGETARSWLRDAKRSDPSTGTYRSWWGNKRAWFVQTAGFEFIWVDHG